MASSMLQTEGSSLREQLVDMTKGLQIVKLSGGAAWVILYMHKALFSILLRPTLPPFAI